MLEAMSAPPLTLALFTGSLRPDGVSAAAAHSVKSVLPGHLQAVDVAFGGFPLYHPGLHLGPLGSPDGADLPEPVRSAYRVVRDAAGVIIVTPEYIQRVTKEHPDLEIYAFRLDRGLSPAAVLRTEAGQNVAEERGLNDHQYIVPGAGGVGEILNNAWV